MAFRPWDLSSEAWASSSCSGRTLNAKRCALLFEALQVDEVNYQLKSRPTHVLVCARIDFTAVLDVISLGGRDVETCGAFGPIRMKFKLPTDMAKGVATIRGVHVWSPSHDSSCFAEYGKLDPLQVNSNVYVSNTLNPVTATNFRECTTICTLYLGKRPPSFGLSIVFVAVHMPFIA